MKLSQAGPFRPLLGVLLGLLSLALTAVGAWYVTALGTSGTASFTWNGSSQAVQLPPSVLNRTDADVTLRASVDKGSVFATATGPGETQVLLGESKRTELNSVSTRSWELQGELLGSKSPSGLDKLDTWQQPVTKTGSVVLTVAQSKAPQSVLLLAPTGKVTKVTMEVAQTSWFVRALIATVLGLVGLAASLFLLWPAVRALAARGSTGRVTAPGRSTTAPIDGKADPVTRESTRADLASGRRRSAVKNPFKDKI